MNRKGGGLTILGFSVGHLGKRKLKTVFQHIIPHTLTHCFLCCAYCPLFSTFLLSLCAAPIHFSIRFLHSTSLRQNGHGYAVPLPDVKLLCLQITLGQWFGDHTANVWLPCSTGCSDKAVQWHLKEECALMEQIIHMFLWDRFFEVVLSVIATTGGNVWTTFIGLFSGVCQNRVLSELEVLRLKTLFFSSLKSRWKKRWNPYIFLWEKYLGIWEGFLLTS